MSLRTRRSTALLSSLVFLAVACTGANQATQAPPTAARPSAPGTTTAPGTPSGETTAPGTPSGETTAPGTPSGETTAPGTPSGETTAPGTPSGEDAPPEQQILRIYCCATDPRSLQPQAASGSDEISILSGIQRGLLYYDKDLGLVPSLATDLPEVSDDGLTYTYHMREDAVYSDGTPIVAADIVRGARHLADPRNAFDYGYEMCNVEGVDAVMGADFGCSGDTPYLDAEAGTFDDTVIDPLLEAIGVTATDEHTVTFTLKQPTSFWPSITGMWLLTPIPDSQTTWAEAADIVSSGPYMIESWTHNASMVLVPNPNWYGDVKPTVQRIEMGIGGDPAAAVAAFERGDLDMVSLPSTEVRRVLADSALSPMANRGTSLSLEYYDFANCVAKDSAGKILCPPNAAVGNGARVPGGSPSQNLNFRIALTEAIDKNELIDVGFAGLGKVADTPTMPGIPGFPTDYHPFSFDVAAALELMSTALDELDVAQPDPTLVLPATDTCDDPCQAIKARVALLGPLKFGYNCDAGHDQRVLYLANAWRTNLGFTGQQMDIRCTDFGTFRTERRAGNVYDIARNGWGADFPHPDNQNRDLFACGAGNNNSKYCDPAYDDLLNQAAAASSYDESVPFYQDAEKLLADAAPVLFMRYGEGVRLIAPYVAGVQQTAADSQNVGDRFYETIHILAH